MLSGIILFVIYRQLIGFLGSAVFGLWALLISFCSFLRLADFGLSGALVKFVAMRYASADKAVFAMVGSAFGIATVATFVIAFASFPLLMRYFTRWAPPDLPVDLSQLIKWALVGTMLSVLSGVLQGAVEGFNRSDISALNSLFATAAFLGMVELLVPRFGLMGLAWSFSIQNAISLILMALALVPFAALTSKAPGKPAFSFAEIRSILRYGAAFQLNSILAMLYDPLNKFLLATFSDISSVAVYEAASKVVVQLRTLVVNGSKTIIPVLAGLSEGQHDLLCRYYILSLRYLLVLCACVYPLCLVCLPFFSFLFFRSYVPSFAQIGLILVLGWLSNTVMAPIYFANLATGDLRWNNIVHFIIAAANLVLGTLGGILWGTLGVVAGWSLSLFLGSCAAFLYFHRKHRIIISEAVDKPVAGLIFIAAFCIAGYGYFLIVFPAAHLVGRFTVSLSVAIGLLAALLWNPVFRELAGKVRYLR
jgi:O-antigen/teichoic acid export membrane protein